MYQSSRAFWKVGVIQCSVPAVDPGGSGRNGDWCVWVVVSLAIVAVSGSLHGWSLVLGMPVTAGDDMVLVLPLIRTAMYLHLHMHSGDNYNVC